MSTKARRIESLDHELRGRVDRALKRRVTLFIHSNRRVGRFLRESDIVREAVVEFLDVQEQRKEAV